MIKKNEFMDLKGLKCPLPVLKIAKKINQIEVGDKIKVKVDDPKAESDINELKKKMNIKIVEKKKHKTFLLFELEKY